MDIRAHLKFISHQNSVYTRLQLYIYIFDYCHGYAIVSKTWLLMVLFLLCFVLFCFVLFVWFFVFDDVIV